MALDAEIADVEAILAPLPGDRPAGVDLRSTARYRSLRDARSQAREAEKAADRDGLNADAGATDDGLRSNWRPVVRQAAQALTEATKDLEIAVWLTEGLVRVAGLEGLAGGSTVLAGLVENFWDDLFPVQDTDDPEVRFIAAKGLDVTLLQTLRKLPLFNRQDGTGFAVWQYEATLALAQIDVSQEEEQKRYEQRVASGVLPFDTVEAEARLVGAAHWVALRGSAEQAKRAWTAMGDAFEARIDVDDPDREGKTVGTTQVVKVLDVFLEVCNRFAPEDAAAVDPAAATSTAAGATGGPLAAAGPLPKVSSSLGREQAFGREQALQQLDVLADWFRRNEPNSPVGYTLQEAVRRSRMTWPELIAELVPDEANRTLLLTGVGLKRPDAG